MINVDLTPKVLKSENPNRSMNRKHDKNNSWKTKQNLQNNDEKDINL